MRLATFLFACTVTSGSVSAGTIAGQNFDGDDSWAYTSDVSFFDNGADGFFGPTTNARPGFEMLSSLDNLFLGVRDLDDEGDFGGKEALLTFQDVNTSGFNDVFASFDFQTLDWDVGDQFSYRWIVDGIDQPANTVGMTAGFSQTGTITSPVFPTVTSLGLTVQISQNGQTDFAGFDNFVIQGEPTSVNDPRMVPEPSTGLIFCGIGLASLSRKRRRPNHGQT